MTSSSRALSVAVVGAGHWGPHLIRNFHENPDSQVSVVVEPDRERRGLIQDRYPTIEVSGDVSAITRPEVEAVVVASPTHTHHHVAGLALRAGKHALVEKPLAISSIQARELCELAQANELVLMVGHVFLFNPGVHAIKEAIVTGEIGDVRLITLQRTNLGPIRTDVNSSWDLASHDLSIAGYLLDAEPRGVSAVGGSWLQDGNQDAVFMSLDYPDGVLVHVEASWLHPRKTREVTVVGSERMATFDDMNLNEPVRIYDKSVSAGGYEGLEDTFGGFRASIVEGEVRIPRVRLGEPLRDECNEFIARVRGESESKVSDGWFGLSVVEVLEAADKSMSNAGSRVEVAG